MVGGAIRTRTPTRNLPLKALISLQYLQQIPKSLWKNRGLNCRCQHQKKIAESEDETQKSGESQMSQYYLCYWQGHPAGFIVESTMQHCCLLASQRFSHHAKTPCVSGLPYKWRKLPNQQRTALLETGCILRLFDYKHCCGALILYPQVANPNPQPQNCYPVSSFGSTIVPWHLSH